MKALVLLVYYERPKMVRNALESLLWDQGDDWRCVFLDDGSVAPGRPVAEEVLAPVLDRVEFLNTGDSVAKKKIQNGSRHGEVLNHAVGMATEDVVLTLCDDDALVEGAIPALLRWYEDHPEAKWSYGHVSVYDPSREAVPKGRRSPRHWLNRLTTSISPSCMVDSTQVSFRMDTMLPFATRQTANLDADIFHRSFAAFGPCPYNGLTVQYKGIHEDQLGNRQFGPRQFEVRTT